MRSSPKFKNGNLRSLHDQPHPNLAHELRALVQTISLQNNVAYPNGRAQIFSAQLADTPFCSAALSRSLTVWYKPLVFPSGWLVARASCACFQGRDARATLTPAHRSVDRV